MTLMNGLIYEGKAYLWTDSLFCDVNTGEPQGHVAKAFTGALWPWAILTTGFYDMNDPHRIARRVAEALPMTTEALLQAGVDALRAELAAGLSCRLLVAVPCPDYGARLYFIAADETGLTPPFVPLETIEFMSSGNGSKRYAEIDALGFTPARMLGFIDYQHETPTETVGGRREYSIGGEVIELVVSAEGVTQRTVRQWPYRVGERIAGGIHHEAANLAGVCH